MELINNFSEIFLSVWNKGILGVDIFQIFVDFYGKSANYSNNLE